MGIGDGKKVMIVGAGLAGSLLACYLAKMGYQVAIYERRGDPRATGYQGGRSINLALSARGIKGLAGVGLAERVLGAAIPMRGRMMHGRDRSTAFQAYSKNKSDAINSVSRGGLNLALIEAAAAYPNVTLHFDCRCLDIDVDSPRPAAVFEQVIGGPAGGGGGAEAAVEGAAKPRIQIHHADADLIVGADGAFSAVRGRMQKIDRFDYTQTYLEHGYKELHFPPSGNPKAPHAPFAMEKNALHIWPRGGSMMIALPNGDGSFTATLFWPYAGKHSFDALKTPEQVERFFNEEYPDAVPLMPTLKEDFFRNPTSSLVTVRCWPWQHARRIVILGDASHAIVPFFGQGMNCAFEDCLALAESLEKHRGDQLRALEEFQNLRKPNTEAIADLALENFIEMRDKVASRAFRWKKKVEHLLHAIFPNWYVPLYNMISFSTIPYAEARDRARRRGQVVQLVAVWAGVVALALLLVLVISMMR